MIRSSKLFLLMLMSSVIRGLPEQGGVGCKISSDINYGRWIRTAVPWGSTNVKRHKEKNRVRRCAGWTYQTQAGCNLSPPKAAIICASLRCRPLLVVGDSLSRNMCDALARAAGGGTPVHQEPDGKTIKFYRNNGQRATKGQVQKIDYVVCKHVCGKRGIHLRWWRHDHLFGHFSPGRDLERDEWVTDAASGAYGTVLLNTDAHLTEYNGSSEIYRQVIGQVFQGA